MYRFSSYFFFNLTNFKTDENDNCAGFFCLEAYRKKKDTLQLFGRRLYKQL